MESKELLAAARRLRSHGHITSKALYHDDVGACAAHVLANVRDDDGELITEDWFDSLCGNEHRFLWITKDIWLYMRPSGKLSIATICSEQVINITTRGQLRRLLEVLGGAK